MKVFISFDMEGVAGIVDWSQCIPPGQPYEEGRRLLLGEVNLEWQPRPNRALLHDRHANRTEVIVPFVHSGRSR